MIVTNTSNNTRVIPVYIVQFGTTCIKGVVVYQDGFFFEGTMSHLRIWKTALSDEAIAQNRKGLSYNHIFRAYADGTGNEDSVNATNSFMDENAFKPVASRGMVIERFPRLVMEQIFFSVDGLVSTTPALSTPKFRFAKLHANFSLIGL